MKSFVFKLLLILHLLPKKHVIEIYNGAIRELNYENCYGMCTAIRNASGRKYGIWFNVRDRERLFKHYGFTRNNFIKYCSYNINNDNLYEAIYYAKNKSCYWMNRHNKDIRTKFLEYLINKLSKK